MKAGPLKALLEREEKFCHNIVAGMTGGQAALEAGFAASNARSDLPAQLMRRPRVVKRIEQLRATEARRLHYTVATIIAELEDVQARAKRKSRFADEIKAIMAKVEMLGLAPKPLAPGSSPVNVNLIFKPLAVPTEVKEMSVEDWQAKWSPKEIEHHNGSGNGHG
jgi:hypothetical protein